MVVDKLLDFSMGLLVKNWGGSRVSMHCEKQGTASPPLLTENICF